MNSFFTPNPSDDDPSDEHGAGSEGDRIETEHDAWFDLADRAFGLEAELGQQFRVDYDDQKKLNRIDEDNWKKHAPLYRKYCELLAKLHRSAESLPPEFTRVRECLSNAIQLARRIQGEAEGPDGKKFALHLIFHGELSASASEASHTIKIMKWERQNRDPLANIEANSVQVTPIDMNPIPPKPKGGEANALPISERELDLQAPAAPQPTIAPKSTKGRKLQYDPVVDYQFFNDWQGAKSMNISFKDFCKDRKETEEEGKRTLARVRFRSK